MSSLYRKYRPQAFEEVVGQDHVVTTLKNALTKGAIAHAYLFCGPRGTGKTTVARLLTQALSCDPIDVIEIDAASNRGIDEVRELREKISVVPARSQYKVFIIDEVHMLTKEAFNALLKTLEEPPAHVIFILATTEPDKVIDTIISRTQRFDFKKIRVTDVVTLLNEVAKKEDIALDPIAANLIAVHAEGAMRDALSTLDQLTHVAQDKHITEEIVTRVLGLPALERIQNLFTLLMEKHLKEALEAVAEMSATGIDFYLSIGHCIEYARKVLLELTSPGILDVTQSLSDEQKRTFQKHVEGLTRGEILSWMKYFFEARDAVKLSPIPSLPLEIALIQIVGGVSSLRTAAPAPEKKEKAPLAHEKLPEHEGKVVPEGTPEEGNEQPAEEPTAHKIPAVEIPREDIVNVEQVNIGLDISGIFQRWSDALGQIKQKNFAMGGFLRSGVPVALQGNVLVLSCKYKFHQEKIVDRKNKMELEEVLESIFGQKIVVECVLEDDLTQEQREELRRLTQKQEEELTNNALSIFEGKVVGDGVSAGE